MKSKNLILNTVMVLAAIGILLGGIFFVTNLKSGGSAAEGQTFATVADTTGTVKIQRKGIGYTLEPETLIIADDVITTLTKAQATLNLSDSSRMTLDENTKLSTAQAEGKKEYLLDEGSVYVEYSAKSPVSLRYQGGQIRAEDAAFSLKLYENVPNLYVLDGSVFVSSDEDDTEMEVSSGESLFVGSDGAFNKGSFEAQSLSGFDLSCAARSEREALQSESASFEAVIAQREEYTRQALLKKVNEAPKQPQQEKKEPIVMENPPAAELPAAQPPAEQPSAAQQPGSIQIEQKDSGKNEPSKDADHSDEPSDKQTMTATISIDCSTILDNMDQLKPSKSGYVPGDGMILYPIEVEFTEGETAFDVLKRVCSSADIQLEYSWNAGFGSNYIEGINHLYEFDCGDGSGWMYHVNGWYPDRGVSVYELSDGDYIEFRYTCSLGVDLGARV